MQRIILRNESYVIQYKFLFWWVDETAKNEYGDDLPCTYSFDTLEEALLYANKDVMLDRSVLELYLKRVKALEELTKIQCNDGNWNHDPYMHGMANGLILALSTMTDKDLDYLDPLKQWLCDLDTEEKAHVTTDSEERK